MAATSLDAEQLHDAFQVFNRHSGLLEASYRDLQNTVAALTDQLRREQTALLEERLGKERLGRELTALQQRNERLATSRLATSIAELPESGRQARHLLSEARK